MARCSASLLVHLLLVELKFLTLKNVAVSATGLAGAGGDAGEKSTGVELLDKLRVDLSILVVSSDLGLNVTGALVSNSSSVGLLLLLLVELNVILAEIEHSEGVGINENNAVLDDSLGSNELVVRRVVHDIEDLGLLGDGLRAPGEVTSLETEGSELVVATSASHRSNSRVTELSVGGLSTHLELSLLLMDGHAAGRGSSLVS